MSGSAWSTTCTSSTSRAATAARSPITSSTWRTPSPSRSCSSGVGLERRGLIREGLAAGEEELAQNARRWTTLGVDPFEIVTEDGRRTWRQLLLAIEKDLVLAGAHPGMVADDLADYLFARSTGHFASLMTLIARGCRRAVRTGTEKLTRDLLDQVRNDAAAEAARQELLAAFDAGKLSARPPAARAKALAAG